MNNDSWIVVWPCGGFPAAFAEDLRAWPASVESIADRHYDKKAGGCWFAPEDGSVHSLMEAFKAAYGMEPLSFRVGRYQKGREDEHPFYFLNVADQTMELADTDIYESQQRCGNPPLSLLRIGNNGCGQAKRQIADLRASRRYKQPRTDLFRIVAGPRFPYSRVYGVSARMREAMVLRGISGCDLRPILDASGEHQTGVFQLTVTGSPHGAIPVDGALIDPKPCDVCGFVVGGLPGLPPLMRTYPRNYFAETDVQVGDLLVVGATAMLGGDAPPVFASARFVRMLQEERLTGWSRAADHVEFWPVSIA